MANEKEAKNKKETKNKKSFFKDFKAELKKVIWPTPKQLVKNTIAVVVIVLITAAIVFLLDVVFDVLNKYGINNLKARIRGENTIQVENTISAENQVENTVETEQAENTATENTAVENETVNE